MATPDPSPQQAAVLSAVATSDTNIGVDSKAGTGKTTSLVMTAAAAPASTKIVAMAFAKRNALDLQKRMPPNVDSSTINSYCHRAWMRRVQPKVTLDTKKVWSIAAHAGIEFGTLPDWPRLMGLARANCILPTKAPGDPTGVRITDDWVEQLVMQNGFDIGEHSIAATTDFLDAGLALSIDLGWRGTIDFDDQIYLCAIYGPGKSTYDLGLIDEAQDLTPAQAQVFERLNLPRVLFFGDPNQGIYAFRGAMPSAFEELTERFSARIMQLNVSFRCPKAVVQEARRYVPDFFAHDSNIEGLVSRSPLDPCLLPKPLTILCRNNAPLTRAAYSFLKEGIGVNFVGGQDLAKQLMTLLKKLLSSGASSLPNALDAWELNEAGKLTARKQDPSAVHDRADTLRTIMDRVGAAPEKLNLEIQRMFTSSGVITMSTIHKAKGMEWPDVALLEFGLIGKRVRNEVQRIQERNLAYVAITRAQRTLTYLE